MERAVNKLVNHILSCEILVVGGGWAGIFAAIKAKETGKKVILVDKGYVGRSGCSPFAAGGINVRLPEDDLDTWLEEIVTRGEYLNDQEWVKIQLEEGYKRVAELQSWGKDNGKPVIEEDSQGKYVRSRVRGNIHTLTCFFEALPAMDTLRRQTLKVGVEIVERVMATHLVMHEGRVVGVLGLHCRTAEIYLFMASAVVLAAGGCGFKAFYIGHHNLTGEAQYMAYEAGAWQRGLDQAQSNSTARNLDIHGMGLLASRGGRFLNSQGEEFMLRYDPKVGNRARLTRVVIGMAKEVDAGRGPIYFDLTQTSPEDRAMLRTLLPEGFRAFDRAGIDPFKEKIEWIPAFMGTLVHGGGIHINTKCESTVPGLYAIGDSSCTPEHGTYSLAGLNMTFCLVSGERAGRFAAEYVAGVSPVKPEQVRGEVELAVQEILAPVKTSIGIQIDELTYRLQENLIPYRTGYIRNESSLKEALTKVQRLHQEELPRVHARDPHELVKANELRSMILVGEMILQSVLFRHESRGFVYREDFPYTDNINWLKWIMVSKGEDGSMKVWAQDFPTPYVKPPQKVYPPFGGDTV